MFDLIYVEEDILDHPRTRRICARFPKAQVVPCQHYGEIFNRSAQNFRLQKRRPALILAHKHGHLVLPTPPGYGIGSESNYYFSHMLNCVYDCRYCFLQGMYRSAHMVVFVNYEDFQSGIDECIAANTNTPYFFSGYDGDSLALEGITDFTNHFLDFFATRPSAFFELRTKSIRIQSLLKRPALSNCVVAFSLTPETAATALEHGAPPVSRRLETLGQLAARGWPIGLRFDPLIYHRDWRTHYADLFAQTFARISPEQVHSVSLGQFRLPSAMYKRMQQLYPEEKLFAWGLKEKEGQVSYRHELATEIHNFCVEALLQYIDEKIFFPCPSTTLVA
ncbi:MAG: spore photoproduct lyase [Candidatus Latescibacterota bacterium]|jgi:spore photoproduct lyase